MNQLLDKDVNEVDMSRDYRLVFTNTNLSPELMACGNLGFESNLSPLYSIIRTGQIVPGKEVELKLRKYRSLISKLKETNPELVIGGVTFEPMPTLEEGARELDKSFIDKHGIGIH